MNSQIFDADGEWYSKAITGYVVTAAAVSIGLSAVMAAGVV